jgi:hypothetical protein
MRHKQDEPIGVLADGSIAVFDTEEAARIVCEAHERAVRRGGRRWSATAGGLSRSRLKERRCEAFKV